jgi:hypothetical protein
MSTVTRGIIFSILLGPFFCWVTVTAETSWSEAQLQIATTLERMKGHLISARENYRRGQIPLAQAHATHPLHEEYKTLPSTFPRDHPWLDQPLREAFTRLQQSVGSQRDVAAIEAEANAVLQLLDQGLRSLLGTEIFHNPQFRSAISAHLLAEIADEYDEAIKDGKVVNIAEYQDAFGFLQRVRALVEQQADRLSPADRPLITALLKTLEEALPSIMPPPSPVSAQAVKQQTAALSELLRKSVEP